MPAEKPRNTKLAKKLKQRFLDDREVKKAKRAKEEKKKREEAKKKGEKHVDSNEPLKGILAKNSKYATNGYKYLKAQDGRGVYKNVDHSYFVHIKDLVADHCKFPDTKHPDNFNPDGKFGQNRPYTYQAHHILPGESFYCELSSGPIFPEPQIDLILKSEYNINNGHNIIMLPTENEFVCVHMLMQHKGNHPKYSGMVMKGLKKISKKLQKIIDQAKPHEDVTAKIEKELENLETAYWNWIVKVSRSVISKVAGNIEYVYDPIKFKTSKKKRPWGSLA